MDSSFKILMPHPAISHFIRYYWILIDDGQAVSTPELMLPDGYSEIIFNRIDEPYERIDLHTSSKVSFPVKSYVITSNGKSLFAKRIRKIDMIGVKLTGYGLHKLLGIPIRNLSEEPVYINDLGNFDLKLLEALLLETNDEEVIKNLLDRFFIGKVDHTNNNAYVEALKMIIRNNGCISIQTICKALNISYNTLKKEFDMYCGMSPKAYQRMVRFRTYYCGLQRVPQDAMLDKRYLDWGYFDQTHFIKEFKYFTQSTPSQFFRDRNNFSTEISNDHLHHDFPTPIGK